jgi:hypothetical protein
MTDTIEFLGRTFIVLFVCAFVLVVVAISIRSFIGEVRWRHQAWKSRRRHPDLAGAYDQAEGEEKIVIAQQMMMRDRDKERARHNGASGPEYPVLADYYYQPRHRVISFFGDYWRIMRGHGFS